MGKVKIIMFCIAQSGGLDLGLVGGSHRETMSKLNIRKIF